MFATSENQHALVEGIEKNKDLEGIAGLGDGGVGRYDRTVPHQLSMCGNGSLQVEGSTDSKISVILSISTC